MVLQQRQMQDAVAAVTLAAQAAAQAVASLAGHSGTIRSSGWRRGC